MDPYIEARGLWEDFHDKLIGDIEKNLASRLPEQYFVSIGERFYIVTSVRDEERVQGAKSDVAVAMPRGEWSPANAPETAVAVAKPADGPLTMQAFVEESFTEWFLDIREFKDNRLVTSIEILSPSNKQFGTEGWRQYQRKRQGCIEAEEVNFVEIDLLRSGQRMPMQDPWPASPYYLLINRRHQGCRCSVWPAYSLRTLPKLQVPLLPPDADLEVDLQALVDGLYERSRYHLRIDYSRPPHPPLSPDEATWLEEQRLRGTLPRP
jgi:hypothetical protein